MKTIFALTIALLLTGCFGTVERIGEIREEAHDLIKDVEGKAYDSIAKAFSEFCGLKDHSNSTVNRLSTQEALELRREIRQRGSNGPDGPVEEVLGLDDQTANGSGPVVRVWCRTDTVPQDVWEDFIR